MTVQVEIVEAFSQPTVVEIASATSVTAEVSAGDATTVVEVATGSTDIVEVAVGGPQGPAGSSGFVKGTVAPTDTSLVWVDTTGI